MSSMRSMTAINLQRSFVKTLTCSWEADISYSALPNKLGRRYILIWMDQQSSWHSTVCRSSQVCLQQALTCSISFWPTTPRRESRQAGLCVTHGSLRSQLLCDLKTCHTFPPPKMGTIQDPRGSLTTLIVLKSWSAAYRSRQVSQQRSP